VVPPASVPTAELQSLPMIRSPSVRLSEAREGRVWLGSPCVLVAYWECPRRPPRRYGRPGPGPQRLRAPAQAPPLQPPAAPYGLSVRADQHEVEPLSDLALGGHHRGGGASHGQQGPLGRVRHSHTRCAGCCRLSPASSGSTLASRGLREPHAVSWRRPPSHPSPPPRCPRRLLPPDRRSWTRERLWGYGLVMPSKAEVFTDRS
jgi:hypothetical protein